jgi:hypothetical protein
MPTHVRAVIQKAGNTKNIAAITKFSNISPKALFNPMTGSKLEWGRLQPVQPAPLSPTHLPRGARGFLRQPETIIAIEQMPKAFMRLPCAYQPGISGAIACPTACAAGQQVRA